MDGAKTIYLAGGCFWGTEAYLSRLAGVLDTECGYANGNILNPSYEQVCTGNTGHAETVRVIYDPAILPLKDLILEYFKTINPTSKNRQGEDSGTQYRTGIYYSDENEAELIREIVSEKQKEYNKPIAVEIQPFLCFYKAEEYHQDYLIKNPNGYCHVDLSRIPEERKKL